MLRAGVRQARALLQHIDDVAAINVTKAVVVASQVRAR
jgi:hypothetical protein